MFKLIKKNIALVRYASSSAAAAAAVSKSPIIAETVGRVTVKPLTSRKTFLLDYYKNMMDTHPLVLFAHYNNLNKDENNLIRGLCKSNESTLTVLRNSIFKVFLKNSNKQDPASHTTAAERDLLVKNHPLKTYLKGPTCCISFKELNPEKLKDLLTVLKKHQDKIIIVGAKLENDALDLEKLLKFKDLPSKSVLQQQLLGVLHMLSGAGLVNTLEMGSSNSLYLTLKSHENELQNKEKETSPEEEVKDA